MLISIDLNRKNFLHVAHTCTILCLDMDKQGNCAIFELEFHFI